MELTAEGKVLMSMVVPLFMLIEEMRDKVQKPIPPVEETVHVSATHAVLSYYLPPFIEEFSRMYPRVSFELYGGTVEDILASIETGRADFAIAGTCEKSYGLVATDLFETTCKLVFSKKVGAFRMKHVSLEEIARLPYISFPPTTYLSRFIEKYFSEKGLKLSPKLMINNIEIMKKYVELGLGVTIFEDFAITAEDRKKFYVIDLGAFFEKRKYQLLMREKRYLNPAARAFLDLIRQGRPV
jgi:LysR family cys regulon transcriptional activator